MGLLGQSSRRGRVDMPPGMFGIPDYSDQVMRAVAENALRPRPESAQQFAAGPVPMGSVPAGPDYASHYAMHGRGPDGAGPENKKRNTGQKILKVLGDAALNLSAANGDYGAQLKLRQRALDKQSRQQAEAEFGEHDRIASILMRQGMSADEAELAALNAGKLGEEYNSRFRTRDVAPGHSVQTPDLGGAEPGVWTAPEVFKEGADLVRVDPQAGEGAQLPSLGSPGVTRINGLRSDAEQYADSLGHRRGTRDWGRAVRDFALKSYGPSAVSAKNLLQARSLDQSDTNNRRSTSASRANSIRSNETRRGGYSYQHGSGRGGSADLIGPVYAKDGKRIQYSKSRGQYVPVR